MPRKKSDNMTETRAMESVLGFFEVNPHFATEMADELAAIRRLLDRTVRTQARNGTVAGKKELIGNIAMAIAAGTSEEWWAPLPYRGYSLIGLNNSGGVIVVLGEGPAGRVAFPAETLPSRVVNKIARRVSGRDGGLKSGREYAEVLSAKGHIE